MYDVLALCYTYHSTASALRLFVDLCMHDRRVLFDMVNTSDQLSCMNGVHYCQLPSDRLVQQPQ